MNFSFKTKAFSEPCILIESFRTLNGGLARSYVRLDDGKDERDAMRTHHGERFDLARRHVSDCRKHFWWLTVVGFGLGNAILQHIR